MKNLKLNIERVIGSISGEITDESLKNAIQEFESTYTFVDSEAEAEKYFKECELEGTVYSRENQKLYASEFEIIVTEYYVDAGSVDYVYSVNVYNRD